MYLYTNIYIYVYALHTLYAHTNVKERNILELTHMIGTALAESRGPCPAWPGQIQSLPFPADTRHLVQIGQ